MMLMGLFCQHVTYANLFMFIKNIEMEKLILPLLVSCLFLACNKSDINSQKVVPQIKELIDQDEVFDARRIFESSTGDLPLFDSLIFSSILNNSFNASVSSNNSLDRLFKRFPDKLDAKTKCDLLKIKLQNHTKLFEYQNAYDIAFDLINNYSSFLDSTETADLRNHINLWKGLSNQPPQVVQEKQYKINSVKSLPFDNSLIWINCVEILDLNLCLDLDLDLDLMHNLE